MIRTRTRQRRRAVAALMSMAFIAAACGSDEDDCRRPPPPTRHRSDRRRGTSGDRRRRAGSDRGRPSGEQVEIDWWHIQNNDPGQGRLAGHGRRLHGRAPEREDQHHRDGERGVQGRDPDQHPVRRRSRPVPVVGRRRPARPGRGRRRQRHHRPTSAPFVGDLGEGAVKLYQVDGKQYGIPFNAGMVGFWYNKDLFAQAGIDGPAGDVGRAARRTSRS